jgi:hypothetical protein
VVSTGIVQPKDVLVELSGTSVGGGGTYQDDDDVKEFLKAVGEEQVVVFKFRRPSAAEAAKMRTPKPSYRPKPIEPAGTGMLGGASSVLYGLGDIGGALGGALLGVDNRAASTHTPAPSVTTQPNPASLRHRPVPSTRSFIGTAYVPEDEKRVKAEQERRRREKEDQDAIARTKEMEVRQAQQEKEETRRKQWATFEQNKLKQQQDQQQQQRIVEQDQQQEAECGAECVTECVGPGGVGYGVGPAAITASTSSSSADDAFALEADAVDSNVYSNSLITSNSLMDGADDSDDDLIDVSV